MGLLKKIFKGIGKVLGGIVKGIGKVFKKVFKAILPILKIVLIAVAVYFTFGVAMSYFPAAGAKAFAAGLPGFQAAGVAGAGPMSSWAASMGLGGGLATGAGPGVTAAMLGDAAAITAGKAAHAASALTTTGAATTAGEVAAGEVAAGGVSNYDKFLEWFAGISPSSTAGDPSVLQKLGEAWKGAGFTDKLIIAGTGAKVIGDYLTYESTDEQYQAMKKFRGSYFGREAGDVGPSYAGNIVPPGGVLGPDVVNTYGTSVAHRPSAPPPILTENPAFRGGDIVDPKSTVGAYA